MLKELVQLERELVAGNVNVFIEAQWRALMNMMSNNTSFSSKKLSGNVSLALWIMDSGASHHRT